MNFKKIVLLFILSIIIYLFLYYENNALVTTKLDLYLSGLPSGFNEYKILEISDLQGKEFGNNNINLVSKIEKVSPDLIIITGDLIESSHYDEKSALNFIDQIKVLAPVYFITGNHEVNTLQYFDSLENKLKERGIKILRNSNDTIERNGDSIAVLGLDDPIFIHKSDNANNAKAMSAALSKIIDKNNEGMFKILLSHRPEQFSLYAKYNIDLTFSGHAHGGQVRLPFIGGLYAPNQGFFPKYTSGKYVLNNSIMVVSRGLGNGTIPQRLFNRPEIVVVTLHTK